MSVASNNVRVERKPPEGRLQARYHRRRVELRPLDEHAPPGPEEVPEGVGLLPLVRRRQPMFDRQMLPPGPHVSGEPRLLAQRELPHKPHGEPPLVLPLPHRAEGPLAWVE